MKTGARDNADSLLAEITILAAELEASAALSLYRFGASRAYYNIVGERVASLAETQKPGFETIGAFLEKRLAPALRTCQSIEERQANLSRKLSRATSLLRSWIDVELERQNSALAELDEPSGEAATEDAADRGRALGGGDLLLHRRPVRLSGQAARCVRPAGQIRAGVEPVRADRHRVQTWMAVRSIRRKHTIEDLAENPDDK